MEKVRTYLYNEVSLIVAVVGVVMGAYLMLSNPTQANTVDVQLLKKDISEITVIKLDLRQLRETQIEMDKKLDRAVYILEQAIKNNP